MSAKHDLTRQRLWFSGTFPPITVVGCGTIGSWLAEALHRAGATEVLLVDPDLVSSVNICSQNFKSSDIGRPKSEVLAMRYDFESAICRLDAQTSKLLAQKPLVFATTDNLASRKLCGKLLAPDGLLVDVRLGKDLIVQYASLQKDLKSYYKDAHALNDSQVPDADTCSKVSTITQSMIAGAIAVETAVQWLNGAPFNKYSQLCVSNMASMAIKQEQ